MTDSIFFDEIGSLNKYPWGFWNDYKHRETAASVCHSRKEYGERFTTSYTLSLKNKEELEYFAEQFFDKPTHRPSGYWKKYENRENAAKQCNSISEFLQKFGRAYENTSKEELYDFSKRFFDERKYKPSGYWNSYENRLNAARQCHSLKEYREKFSTSYEHSLKIENELREFSNRFFTEIKKKKYNQWDIYENRMEAAKQCHSRMDYKDKFPSSYSKSLKFKGELDKFADMFFDKKNTFPKGYWNSYENRLNAAKQCKTQKEYLKKFPGGYDKSQSIKGEMRYFKEIIFENKFKEKGYWKIYENRETAASKCKSKSEYQQKYPVSYRYSKQNEAEFDDFVKRFFNNTFIDDESRIYLIYVYLDYKLMIGYCGLTRQSIGMRDCQHRKKEDRLYKLFVNTYKTTIPKPIVIENGLNRIEAQEKEDYYKQYYINQGFTMLNSGKTGVNIGSIGFTFKYNKERCLECAKCCKSVKEFRDTYLKEYRSALQHEWLDEYEWLEKDRSKKDVTYEECKELAKTCNNISEFGKKYPSEVITARKNKWLYDFFGRPVSWTYEVCYNEAKKYETRSDFYRNCPGAYIASQNRKWLDDFTWLKYKETKRRTFESLLEDVLKYNSLKELRETDGGAYTALQRSSAVRDFYDESGKVKDFVKSLFQNDEEYMLFKQMIDEKLEIYHQKQKEIDKKRKQKRKK